jgi:hypothetical protein
MTTVPQRTSLAYVAGPYRDPRGAHYINGNIERARRLASILWQRGYSVLCPHLNTAHFDGLCSDRAFLDGALEMLRRCDLMVLTMAWHASQETRGEIECALRLGIPIYEYPHLEQAVSADDFALMGIQASVTGAGRVRDVP